MLAMAQFESKILVTGGLSGEVVLINVATGVCVHTIGKSGDLVHINKIIAKDNLLAVGGNPWIRVHSLDNIRSPPTIYNGHKNNVTTISFQQDSKWFITAGEDGQALIWDLRGKGYQTSINHGPGINCGCLHPNQGVFLFGDQEGYLNQLDLAANKIIRSSVGSGSGIGVSNLAIDSFGRAVCSHDNKIVSIFKDISLEEDAVLDLDENLNFHDDSSPRNALSAPPMLLPLISRSVSSPKPPVTSRIKEHTTLHRSPPDAIGTFGKELEESTYVTSVKYCHPTNRSTGALAVSYSTGFIRLFKTNSYDGTFELQVTMEPMQSQASTKTWCWDTVFLDEDGKLLLSSFASGECVLTDSTRPLEHVTMHVFGETKFARTMAIVAQN